VLSLLQYFGWGWVDGSPVLLLPLLLSLPAGRLASEQDSPLAVAGSLLPLLLHMGEQGAPMHVLDQSTSEQASELLLLLLLLLSTLFP
jgi:hypothetical protein